MIDTDNVKGKYCSKQEMIFYLNAVEEAKQLRSTIDYIREVGRMDRIPTGHLMSIMENVLTAKEYLEWVNKLPQRWWSQEEARKND
jgi:hypothetical protein